jgi:hypothetical protein
VRGGAHTKRSSVTTADTHLRTHAHAGMAGSGKTTLMQRLNAHSHQHGLASYFINLDPAVTHLPYGANIDIRDTVCAGCVLRAARGLLCVCEWWWCFGVVWWWEEELCTHMPASPHAHGTPHHVSKPRAAPGLLTCRLH